MAFFQCFVGPFFIGRNIQDSQSIAFGDYLRGLPAGASLRSATPPRRSLRSPTKTKLEEHIIIAHGQGERKFKCDTCDSKFTNQSFLNKHVESHHAKKTLYRCEQCPKTFWMKSYLKTHVRMMHENYRPHKCDICQEGFVYKRDVVRHKKHIHNILLE